MQISEIKEHYEKFKLLIKQRMFEFEKTGKRGQNEIFRELCFCILTAGTSAELGIKTINHLGDVIFDGSEEETLNRLKEVYRFYNVRARFIFLARENFKKINLDDKSVDIRDKVVENIKGIGYKEASHFLRNIGFKGYGILDKHIINCLFELGVIKEAIPPKNKRDYLEIEEKMKKFSEKIRIDFDELDLVLWSFKTGKVLK